MTERPASQRPAGPYSDPVCTCIIIQIPFVVYGVHTLMVTKKHVTFTRRQYNPAKRFYSYRLPQHGLPLKACQDLCGLRDCQRTRLFLNNHGLDRVIFGDNDKTLLRKKAQNR